MINCLLLFFLTESKSSDLTKSQIIVFSTCVGLILVGGLTIFFCLAGSKVCPCCCQKGPILNNKSLATTENMIPPIFYTEELQDPLMQTDLKEHFHADYIK